jgi:hypothetical protein
MMLKKSTVFCVVTPCSSERGLVSEEHIASTFGVGEQAKQEISRRRRQAEAPHYAIISSPFTSR